ncbi:hypothetical protein NDA17_003800 [Ustilago hordei]|nr:hypothetical protein NDA17_003800 [Ustilago hordei]
MSTPTKTLQPTRLYAVLARYDGGGPQKAPARTRQRWSTDQVSSGRSRASGLNPHVQKEASHPPHHIESEACLHRCRSDRTKGRWTKGRWTKGRWTKGRWTQDRERDRRRSTKKMPTSSRSRCEFLVKNSITALHSRARQAEHTSQKGRQRWPLVPARRQRAHGQPICKAVHGTRLASCQLFS